MKMSNAVILLVGLIGMRSKSILIKGMIIVGLLLNLLRGL
ncbi:hypothetical protein HMPREF3206_01218 [Fusobacterium equinum]|uniref:Uncharacterized protein n=1 Tax=Fusobacterium equinum TaxID=134605 RepID=A0A133NBW7_9FUSO|nr:hypothetical protein HMPREF3206_01218 [Fusobacterium equinum]